MAYLVIEPGHSEGSDSDTTDSERSSILDSLPAGKGLKATDINEVIKAFSLSEIIYYYYTLSNSGKYIFSYH